ncbi:MAG: hypothetical protein AAF974_06475 [Cyanobacteria bacterium P01_E01_bin.34]
MLRKSERDSTLLFSQVVVANLKYCQIAIPTTTQLVAKRIFSTPVDIPERIYAAEGWMIVDGQTAATIQSLQISPLGGDNSPFSVHPHLGPAVPITFEAVRLKALPASISSEATFVCKLPDEIRPFYSMFRQVKPRFVRVYPFGSARSLTDIVQSFLIEEKDFVLQNSSQLRNVPFYRDEFRL